MLRVIQLFSNIMIYLIFCILIKFFSHYNQHLFLVYLVILLVGIDGRKHSSWRYWPYFGENAVECSICKKVFKTKFSYDCHKWQHEDYSTYKHKCPKCGIRFYRKDRFNRHIAWCDEGKAKSKT